MIRRWYAFRGCAPKTSTMASRPTTMTADGPGGGGRVPPSRRQAARRPLASRLPPPSEVLPFRPSGRRVVGRAGGPGRRGAKGREGGRRGGRVRPRLLARPPPAPGGRARPRPRRAAGSADDARPRESAAPQGGGEEARERDARRGRGRGAGGRGEGVAGGERVGAPRGRPPWFEILKIQLPQLRGRSRRKAKALAGGDCAKWKDEEASGKTRRFVVCQARA